MPEPDSGFGLTPRRIAIYMGVVLAFVAGLYIGLPAALDGLSDMKRVVKARRPGLDRRSRSGSTCCRSSPTSLSFAA